MNPSTTVNICIFRLSAMGDVAMTVQAVRNILEHNPTVSITVVTRNNFQVFFGKHDRLHFHSIELKEKHKGLLGLRKLSKELKIQKFDYFLDLHDVLRSKIVRNFFQMTSTKVFVIEKDRKTKKAIVDKKLPLTPQKHTIDRYLDVFKKVGLRVQPNYRYILPFAAESASNTIGIAPFAAHNSKEWGLEKINALLQLLENENLQALLFGGGEKEVAQLNDLAAQFPFCESLAGKHSLEEELKTMSTCKVFIAMDSGNMHLASLVGVPTLSLWFSTHPYLGFAPWGNEDLCIQPTTEELPCRPVSVFGKLHSQEQEICANKAKEIITPKMVFEKIKSLL